MFTYPIDPTCAACDGLIYDIYGRKSSKTVQFLLGNASTSNPKLTKHPENIEQMGKKHIKLPEDMPYPMSKPLASAVYKKKNPSDRPLMVF
jgi:hypothetical protein